MPEKFLPTPYVSLINLEITDRCNFYCPHCLQGEPKKIHNLTPDEARTVVGKTVNPHLDYINIYGGEPRIHPQFTQVVTAIRESILNSGFYSHHDDPPKNRPRQKIAVSQRNVFLSSMSPAECDRLAETGELSVMISRYLDQNYPYQTPIGLEVFTNGFGMRDAASTAEIIKGLYSAGINHVTISTDQPHRDFVKTHQIPIDYDTIGNLSNLIDKGEYGLPQDIAVGYGSIGPYVLPIGRATNYSWSQRIASGYASSVDSLKTELADEFQNWENIASFSHPCYCQPTRFYRHLSRVQKYQPENQINLFGISVDTSGNIQSCPLKLMPSPGNILRQSLDEIYQVMATNKLHHLIANEGPQGIARRLTQCSEEEIKQHFIEATPCGLCQDLVTRYPSDFKALINQTS